MDRRAVALLNRLRTSGPSRFSSLRDAVSNPRTLAAKLRGLGDLGWVEKSDGLYRLTHNGEKAANLVAQLQDLRDESPAIEVGRVPHPYYGPLLQRLAALLLDHFGEDLQGILLFGSVARGDWTRDSDIDVLVLFRPSPRGRRALNAELLAVRRSLRGTPEYRRAYAAGFVPTVAFYPLDQVEASRFRRLYLDAFREGVVIVDRSGQLADLRARFRARLQSAGAQRVEMPSGTHYWVLGDPEVLDAEL